MKRFAIEYYPRPVGVSNKKSLFHVQLLEKGLHADIPKYVVLIEAANEINAVIEVMRQECDKEWLIDMPIFDTVISVTEY